MCHDPELPRRIPVGAKVMPRSARDIKMEVRRSNRQAAARRTPSTMITKVQTVPCGPNFAPLVFPDRLSFTRCRRSDILLMIGLIVFEASLNRPLYRLPVIEIYSCIYGCVRIDRIVGRYFRVWVTHHPRSSTMSMPVSTLTFDVFHRLKPRREYFSGGAATCFERSRMIGISCE